MVVKFVQRADRVTCVPAIGRRRPPINGVPRSDAKFERAKSWIGAGLRSLFGDGAASAEIKGNSLTALQGLLPHAQVDAIALQCGIKPVLEVEAALRAESWLHGYGDPRSIEGGRISELTLRK